MSIEQFDWYVVSPVTNFLGNTEIDTFHSQMFHGLSQRNGTREQLILNLYRPVHLRMPGDKCVVTQEFRDRINGEPGVSFEIATIERVSNIPYGVGDFSHWEDPNYFDDGETPEKLWINSSFSVGKAVATTEIPNLFFLNTCEYRNLSNEFPGDAMVTACISLQKSVFEEELDFPVKFFSNYTMISLGGMILVAHNVLQKLEPLIDWVYFEKSHLTFPD